jgi:hypothetical protein
MKDNHNYFPSIVIGIFAGTLFFTIYKIGKEVERQTIREEAVQRGYGSWVINYDGTKTFKWK